MEENTPPPGSPPATPSVTPPPPLPATLPPPPVIVPPASRPAPKRGRGWMIFALVLLLLLGISLLFHARNVLENVGLGKTINYTRSTGPKLEEAYYEDNGAADKIVILKVEGIISDGAIDPTGNTMVDLIKAQLKRADEDERVKAVILKVDSPGGEVLASDDIYREIAGFQKKTHKPVVASMGSLAASGGYYISSPCRWIVANELTITGSIGVIMSSYNYRGLLDKVGVQPMTFKSGKFKDMLSGTREPDSITPQERDMVQALIDETFKKFKSVVQEGRNGASENNKGSTEKSRPLSDRWEEYADGRVLSGKEALNLGFVDQLGGFDTAVERAKKIAGIGKANLVEYQQRFEISDLFRLFGKSEGRVLKVDVGIEPPKLKAGQPYFLSSTFAH
jgi:protease IV